MNYDPHALHQILLKIQDQMRCPQCSETVHVDFPSVKLAGDDFLILQLKCDSCGAFIVLHVTLTGAPVKAEAKGMDGLKNASSSLTLDEKELGILRDALKGSDGSFEKLFKENQIKQKHPKAGGTKPDSIA